MAFYSTINYILKVNMLEIVAATTAAIKVIGEATMLELAKSAWVKFCVGVAIAAYPVAHLVEAVRWW